MGCGMSATRLGVLVDAVMSAADDCCRLVRVSGDTARLTRGGQWTVRDTAVHLIGFSKIYAALLADHSSPVSKIEEFDVVNQAMFMVLDGTDPGELADELFAATLEFCARAATLDDEAVRPWHLGLELPVVDHVALIGNELLMHGWDIAAVTGNESAAVDAATPVVEQLATLWPGFFRTDLGDGVRFALHVSGLRPVVYVFGNGTLRLETESPLGETDCATTGSAMNHLLWLGGRATLADSDLIVAGDRPELADLFGFPLST